MNKDNISNIKDIIIGGMVIGLGIGLVGGYIWGIRSNYRHNIKILEELAIIAKETGQSFPIKMIVNAKTGMEFYGMVLPKATEAFKDLVKVTL